MPLYVSGLLCGAALQIIEAMEVSEMSSDFSPATDAGALYFSPPVVEHDLATLSDRQVDRHDVWVAFHEAGVGGLAERNGLSIEENQELFTTPILDRIVELVLIGLSRLRASGRL